jgi:hypothetical protein
MKKLILLFLVSSFITSCAPATQIPQKEMITVYSTSAAEPWLNELYTCAESTSVVLNVTADAPDIYLRVGEPKNIISPVYQIDEEEILIVANRESVIQNLSLIEAQDLFAQGNASTQVWVYASDADVQNVFDQLVMKSRSVTSFANVAASPQQMSDLLNTEKDTVGILPRQWMAGSAREVYFAGSVPVLAITQAEPKGAVLDLISCLQR